jgi:hypothetical protein
MFHGILSSLSSHQRKLHDALLSRFRFDFFDSVDDSCIIEIVASRVGGNDGINLPNHRLPSFNTYFFPLM